jgi:hypothetical protein
MLCTCSMCLKTTFYKRETRKYHTTQCHAGPPSETSSASPPLVGFLLIWDFTNYKNSWLLLIFTNNAISSQVKSWTKTCSSFVGSTRKLIVCVAATNWWLQKLCQFMQLYDPCSRSSAWSSLFAVTRCLNFWRCMKLVVVPADARYTDQLYCCCRWEQWPGSWK